MKTRVVPIFLLIAVVAGYLSGCSVATAVADANQAPPTAIFSTTESASKVFSGAAQAITQMGQLVSSDRDSGVLQGKKGNWLITVGVSSVHGGSGVSVSARYVPSKQMDFNSREGLTNEFVSKLQQVLGVSVAAGAMAPERSSESSAPPPAQAASAASSSASSKAAVKPQQPKPAAKTSKKVTASSVVQ